MRRALEEDIGTGDVTTAATVAPGTRAIARIVQKAPGRDLRAGRSPRRCSRSSTPTVAIERQVQEGDWREQGGVLEARGDAAALLSGERTALNFLAHLSGVATMAARATRAVEGTGAKVLDTRKTTPGLRALEKEAVAAGGAINHRAGLYDAILIKENHIAAAGGIAAAIERARAAAPGLAGRLEVEVRDDRRDRAGPGGRRAAAAAGQHGPARDCAPRSPQVAGRAELEASGGVDLETLRAVAETGVEWISMGALTHSAPALDLSLNLEVLP